MTWHAATIVVCAVVNAAAVFFTGIALAIGSNVVTRTLFFVAVGHFLLVLLSTIACMAASTRKLAGVVSDSAKRGVYSFFLRAMHVWCLPPVFMWVVVIGIMSRWENADGAANYFVTRTFYGDGFLAANLICVTVVQLTATVILREWGPYGRCFDVQKEPVSATTIGLHAASGRVQGALALAAGGVVLFGIPIFWTQFFLVYVVELVLLALATLYLWTVARGVIGGPNTAPLQLVKIRVGSLTVPEFVKKSTLATRAIRHLGKHTSVMGVVVAVVFVGWCCVRAFMCAACIASATGGLCMYSFFLIDVLATIVAFVATGLLAMLVRIEAYFFAYAIDRQAAHDALRKR